MMLNHARIYEIARAMAGDGWTCEYHEPLPFGECEQCTIGQLRTAARIADAVKDWGKSHG